MDKKEGRSKTEEEEFLEILNSSYYNIENRTKLDRYREFREVFYGSEAGKRVLAEILSLAKVSAPIVPPEPHPVEVNRMLIREGKRELGIQIISILSKEPVAPHRPAKQNVK